MYMMLATILLGILSMLMAVIWRKRLKDREVINIYLEARFGSENVDTSGKTHYSDCISYHWVMKNVIQSKLGHGGEVIRTALIDRTVEGTIAIAIVGSLIPFTLAYLVFVSFALVGGSIIIILMAILVIQAPFDVAASDGLLKWYTKQDPLDFKLGDFAYAKVSFGAISRWIQVLLAIGVIAIVIAPWSSILLEGATYAVVMVFTFALTAIYTPIAAISPALAYASFVSTVVITLVLVFIIPGRLYGIIRKDINIFALESNESSNEIDDETVQEKDNRNGHEVKT
ncbi:MAG: hypothetical protein ACFFD6_02110 [Candidatus Thorarchaeota archaeon]